MRHNVLCLISLLLTLSIPVAAQRASTDTPLEVQHISGPIYMLYGYGGNVAVSVGEDGLLIVDDQYASEAEKISQALKTLSDGKLEFLLNTHHHFDHTGSNPVFGKEAHIIAHENGRKRLASTKNADPVGLPDITFDDTLSLHFNGEEIRLIYYPNGHTDNDIVIYFTKSNVVHMGDLLFTDSFPSFYPANGGGITQYGVNVGNILEWVPDDAKIIAGHGALATKKDVQEFHQMLVETTQIVRDQLSTGKTREEIVAAGLPDRYQRWVSSYTSIERWITNVYNDLSSR